MPPAARHSKSVVANMPAKRKKAAAAEPAAGTAGVEVPSPTKKKKTVAAAKESAAEKPTKKTKKEEPEPVTAQDLAPRQPAAPAGSAIFKAISWNVDGLRAKVNIVKRNRLFEKHLPTQIFSTVGTEHSPCRLNLSRAGKSCCK